MSSKSTRTFTGKLSVLLVSFLLMSSAVLADGVGFTSGTRPGQIPADRGYRRTGPLSIQHVMVYLNAGERLNIDIQRISTTGSGVPLEIDVYSPLGYLDDYSILSTVPLATVTTETYTVAADADGIWTIVLDGGANNSNWRYDINAQTADGTRIDGRVFTERLLTTQNTAFDMALFHVNKLGHKFESNFFDFHGIDAVLRTNLSGATEIGMCVPLYKSREGYLSATDCGENFKQFFTSPSLSLPDSAFRYNITSGATYKDWLIPSIFSEPVVISDLAFEKSYDDINFPTKGSFTFTINNFDQVATLLIDVDNNGSYDDPIDRTLHFIAQESNVVTFNGVDGLGNPISCYTTFNAKILIDRGGEIHFTMEDVEGLGGLTVTRLNGLGAPNSTLYWDDRDLAERTDGYVNPTPAERDGRAGVESNVPGGVHGWNFSPVSGWGNDRLIDNWAEFPITEEELEFTVTPECTIVAIDDDYTAVPVSSATGDTLGNILTNDSLYGIGNVPYEKIFLTIVEEATPNYPGAPVPVIDPATGQVIVPQFTPTGLYEIEYTICDQVLPTNCSTAIVYVAVENEILASNDTFYTTPGSTTSSIYGNDTLYSINPDPEKIVTTVLTPMPDGFTLQEDGTILVGPDVDEGTYTFDYEICEKGVVPPNCSTATVVLIIEEPLSIQFLNFELISSSNSAMLNWTTSLDKDIYTIDIERSQTGRDFVTLSSLPATTEGDDHTASVNYSYLDTKPLVGTNFYRIKLNGRSGKSVYSDIRSAQFTNANIQVQPNPVTDLLHITGLSGSESLILLDISGRVIQRMDKVTGTSATFDVSDLNTGIYLIRVEFDNGTNSSFKIIKK